MQEKIIEELRQELKAQTDENQELLKINEEHKKINGELRKENDALITIIDLAKHKIKEQLPVCIMPNNMLIHGTEKAKFLEDLLEILERVNE